MNNPKILIIGSTGMAGHMIYNYLLQTGKYQLFNTVFRNKLTEDSIICDVQKQSDVRDIITKIRPQFIINCVGALIRQSKEQPDKAIFLNSVLPHFLERFSNEMNVHLIHISTDCVFSGKNGNYSENDFCDADDLYGRSKALGEMIGLQHTVLRTSIIGPELKKNGEGLFHWLMKQDGLIDGYSKAYWGGVTTLELAKAITVILENRIQGLLHVTNGEKISKFQLLELIIKRFSKNKIIIKPCDQVVTDKSLLKTEKINFNVPTYEEMLNELFNWMIDNPSLYANYFKSNQPCHI